MFYLEQMDSMADIPRLHGRARPQMTALIFEGRTTTFAEFDRRTNQVAQGLIAEGLSPQSRIAFLGKNSDWYFELLFGAIKARVVLVGINWRLAVPEISYILNDAQCEMLFIGPEYLPLVPALRAGSPTLRTLVVMDESRTALATFPAWRDGQPPLDPLYSVPDDDDVLQLYTSGTTGQPKGVQLTHQNYLGVFSAASQVGLLDAQPGDVSLVCMPVFHVAGTNIGMLALAQGATGVVTREVDPGQILTLIPQYRINRVFVVPAVLLFMLQHPKCAETDFSSVQRLSYGASPIAEELLRRAQAILGCPFVQLYGLTETTGLGTYLPAEAHDASRGKLRSCGLPFPGIDIRVVDESGTVLAAHAVGEIVIRSQVVMKGYWHKPEATAQAIRETWFHTGDAGYFDEEGFLYIHDRLKDMIVSGGENVYPAEVENAVFGHPAVADVAVIGVPDDKWGEAVKAIVVLKPGTEVTSEELIDYARARIAGFKIPRTIDFVGALPRNPSGKILRRELREPFWAGRTRLVN